MSDEARETQKHKNEDVGSYHASIKAATLEALYRVGDVDINKLELPEEVSRAHNKFNVCQLKEDVMPTKPLGSLDGLHIDDKLQFVEEADRGSQIREVTVVAKPYH
ncbi:hypothetical protein Tco_0122697 [Tanacetum coccineum]